jgi:hypothetical protein
VQNNNNEIGRPTTQGTISQYVTNLPYTLDLPGKWEVALTEMFIPHSWHNIDKSNDFFQYYEGNRTDDMPPATPSASPILEETSQYNNNSSSRNSSPAEKVENFYSHINLTKKQRTTSSATSSVTSISSSSVLLPRGYYSNVSQITDAILNSISPVAQKNISIKVNRDGTLSVKTVRNAYLQLCKGLADMLGFQFTLLKDEVRGSYAVDIQNGMYSAFVYTDIILPQIIGDVQAQVLRVLPLGGKPGQLMVFRFNSPDYVTLARSSISSIEINIRTDHGEPIIFNSGKVLCKLHFRPSHS